MTKASLIGAPVPRREDRRFLTGAGCYSADIVLPGQAQAIVVRSPYPHADIRAIETDEARAAPGVLAIYTAADIAGKVGGPLRSLANEPPFDVAGRPDGPAAEGNQPVLADGRVRYAGEPVAFVVAETAAQAREAADLVAVDYEPLPAVTDFAQQPDGPALPAEAAIWPEEAPDNVSFVWERGDGAEVEAAFAAAAHVASVDLLNNRVVVAFMEPRACVAEPEDGEGRLTLHVGCQGAHGMQAGLCGLLGLPTDRLRVVVPDTGGGFGARGGVYPEFVLTLLAARELGRPVGWTGERSESFLSDTQARDHRIVAELALDGEHRFTALRMRADWRHGAYLAGRSIWVMVAYLPPTLGGAYRLPRAQIRLRGLFSNTPPMAALRGIGRVEANYLMESLVDAAARDLGLDPLDLRRRNLVRPEDMPWRAAGGNLITSGDLPGNLDRALDEIDRAGFDARRRDSAARGLLRGLGVGLYVENDGGVPNDYAHVAVDDAGGIELSVGTQDFGMGHATFYAQVAADRLGVPMEAVTVRFGDTDRVARGGGAHGSRTARIGGGAAVGSIDAVIGKGRGLAAELLEAAAGDIDYADGRFTIAGTDRSADLAAVARFARARGERLDAEADFETRAEAHANGCHAVEVEIDPADGRIRIDRHVVVADVGRVINPLIVTGQMHGGAAQGLGQALLERIVYEPESGQTLSGSFMDYAIPRADDLPAFKVVFNEIEEADNPLGVKGAGESACTGAPAAVMNAVRDALAGAGVRQFDMPATPERVWRALLEAASVA